jgi:phospholipid/cholesterol/gamma-HCH transport system substrate-binding protein
VTPRRRRRRQIRRAWTAGLLVLALGSAGCGLSLQDLPKPGGISGASYPLKAVFANVLNLPIQARVLIGSDEVGQVSGIATSHFKADLTLTIRRAIRIPVGTTAQILFVDPLGDEFIQLHPPAGTRHGPYLAPGATLPEQDTSSAPSIADTLAALGALLNGGGLNQLQTIITQLNQALNGHQPQIRDILDGLSATVTSLNANKTNVDNALLGLDVLSTELAKGSTAISTGIDTIGPAVGVLSQENAEFSQLLTSTNQLSAVASSIVDTSSSSIVSTIDQLDAVVDQMVGVEQQFGPTLNDLTRFEQLTKKIAPGSYLQLSLDGTAIVEETPVLGPNTKAAHTDQSISGLLGAGLP